MKLYEAIIIALRGLLTNKMRSILTMLGVIIGVGSVITLVSIGEGVKESISKQIQGLGSNLVLVTPGRGAAAVANPLGTTGRLTFEDALAVEQNAGAVKNVAPVIESSGNVQFKDSRVILISGTTEGYSPARNFSVASGNFIGKGDVRGYRQVAVLGHAVRQSIFPSKDPVGQIIKINGNDFKVIGVMERKGRTLTIDNDNRVIIPITLAKDILGTDQVNMIFVQSESPGTVSMAVDETKRIIRDRHDRLDFTVSEQKDILNTFQGIMGTLTGMLGGIAGVSLLVGGIGIMNIMLVTVTERTREIGIRKAVGAKKMDILVQFLLESVFISALGGLLGIGAGIVGARLLNNLIPRLPTVISPWSIAIAFLFALLVGLFFGIYPARKAAGLDPIDALRYE